jgi:hypothetical protein
MSTKERSIKAALEVLNGASTPSVAAATWGVGTGNVHYYKKSLQDQGMGVSPIPSPSPLVEADAVSLLSKAADWDAYSAAYVMAGELVFAGKSLRAAADEASAKYSVKLSYSSARRAAAQQIPKLLRPQLEAALSFRGVAWPQGALKPALVLLLSGSLTQLPTDGQCPVFSLPEAVQPVAHGQPEESAAGGSGVGGGGVGAGSDAEADEESAGEDDASDFD